MRTAADLRSASSRCSHQKSRIYAQRTSLAPCVGIDVLVRYRKDFCDRLYSKPDLNHRRDGCESILKVRNGRRLPVRLLNHLNVAGVSVADSLATDIAGKPAVRFNYSLPFGYRRIDRARSSTLAFRLRDRCWLHRLRRKRSLQLSLPPH